MKAARTASVARKLTIISLALFVALIGCSRDEQNKEVELAYRSSLGQWIRDFFFGGDNYQIRLHVYDKVTPLPSSTRMLVRSIGNVEFSVPKRALMKNIASGSGDKDVLPLLFHSGDGVVEPLREGRQYDGGRLLEVNVRGISVGMIKEYRENIFKIRTSISSLSSARNAQSGFNCSRNDSGCILRMLADAHGRKEFCNLAVFTYDDRRGEGREGAKHPYPLSAGNIFVPISEVKSPHSFVACDRHPRGAACIWYGLYRNTYPISISVGSEGICEAERSSQEVIRWLDQMLLTESP